MVAKEELNSADSKNAANISKSILLNNIKNNFFEKDNKIILTLYVKNVNPSEAHVEFGENSVSLTFKTNDLSFLKQYNTEDLSTKFKWDISLDGRVDASKCTYKINSSTIEINLSKHQATSSVKWTNAIKPYVQPIQSEIKNDQVSSSSSSNSATPKKTTKTNAVHHPARSRSASSSVSPSPPQTYRVKPVTPPKIPATSLPQPAPQSTSTSTSMNINPNATNTYYGFVGLANLGNTCYMNAALQCLLNTTDLRDYFLNTPHLFQKELNTNNSLGLNGRLAIGFAMLMKQIWKSTTSYIAPNQLRDLICSKYAHFRGYEQQDTHEFLCSLMSILHEDLNRVLKKPFYESGLECEDESFGQEFKIAQESWQRFLSRENSIIVDNFYGQFKSKLICPECNKVSITFEPFNSLLVPIPSPKVNVSFVLMFNLLIRQQRSTIKTSLYVSAHETVQGLIDQVKSKFVELKNSNILAFVLKKSDDMKEMNESDENEYGYIFDYNSTSLSPRNKLPNMDSNNVLILYELENLNDNKEPVLELRVQQVCKFPILNNSFDKCSYCNKNGQIDSNNSGSNNNNNNLRRCTRCFKSAYCNNDCQKSDWKQHSTTVCNLDYIGLPFVFTLRKSTNIELLLRKALFQMSSQSIDLDGFDDKNYELELLDTTDTALANNTNKYKSLNIANISEIFDNAICNNNNNASAKPVHLVLKLQLKWINNNKNFKVKTNFQKINEFVLNNKNDSLVSNLNDCLKLFTHPEKLTSENPWYCSNCKKHQEATKQMNLWKLPKYLIITLKRFQATKASDTYGFANSAYNYLLQNRVVYNKLNSFIDFPLKDLDMSKYVKESNMAQNEIQNFKYDLYGVINHLGQSLYLGHYTSFARTHDKSDPSKDELGWRLFDDSKSISIKNKEQIVTRDAYVLLYRLQPNNEQQQQQDIEEENKAAAATATTSNIVASSTVSNETLEVSEDENSDINSDESEQFNSANQSSDDNCDNSNNNDNFRSKYTNLNDID